ncbi:MAG: single-stranded-DNA-specific exonuclease RecJ [Candidatus Zambryskibacteria bacterium RIFCSPLOWO2_01_FULL_35_19]|uniref:Single-stranded-DNA-specific exonuclease RecJ n=1 Tax=Candidatus Zambryskibacteria bacterium RIFCSPLOWO2_01_FULL_35_19 TaxID=1802757 RepID=A0A1G2TYH9_9BACT|nr:MAG: single-stranded-DNA-specific exonuclease RecJ [Candidatus Zambryskibacteria bacterium RIFCSPHIGHO2_01_FULL_35_32]OHB02365.1 MAG: single-stranded-DNA-specific exonuclease RecJ [Candidatus Zambryskibacteria bacterium RIFCSPLOWO2_01_FULL_35_19]
MSGMSTKYNLKGKVSKEAEEELKDFSPLITQLLYNRDIKTKKEAERFLKPDFEKHLHDPFLLPDMKKVVERILKAIENDEKITIWSDYDADGIPGGALLHDFFKLIGFNNFENYIPNRRIEGYGLNLEGIKEIADKKTKLLITIDCGIRDNQYVEEANKLGMEVVITDHHEPSDELPKAFAIVNPKRKDNKYPEQILCGTGVVWKIIEGILQTKRDLLKEGQEKWLLDLVGLATLSDMVPLTGENRALAHFGLSVLRKGKRPGFSKLLSILRINKNNLTEDDVTFMITPRINAASRMGLPLDAFKLLTANNEEEAGIYAKHLDNINKDRKVAVTNIVKEAKKKVKEKFENLGAKSVIVLGDPDWRPALLGLVANSIVKEYNLPVFLWGREGEGVIKGSCRSEGVTDLVALMERVDGAFTSFGGHKMSGGFEVDFEKIHTLEDALVEACTYVIKKEEEIEVDAELNLKDISEKSVAEINGLAPFGIGNEKPIFIFKDIIPEKINRFGKAKEHLSINFVDGTNKVRGISFFASPDQFGDFLKEGIKTNLVANIEKSFFNGSSEIRLRIVDFF